MTRHLTLPFN